jgi:hypothetical protein
MTKLKMTTLAAALLSMGMGLCSTAILAGDDDDKGNDDVIDDDMSRRGPGSTSGSGDTVEANCGGPDYQGATAELTISQSGSGSKVEVEIEDAVPNTHFTVWMRIKGKDNLKVDPEDPNSEEIPHTGYNPAGSPWTGGGATPLCSGTEFESLNDNSPWNNAAGSTAPLCNSFSTDAGGDGKFKTSVNFPVVGGAYPFQQSGGASARPGHDAHADVPTAIVDPRTGNGGPFMIRVVSHCLDGANHGLSPAQREAWFQYP